MKKILSFFLLIMFFQTASSQELQANVQVNYSRVQTSNTQVFKTLEKKLKEFINNTSWTGRKLQNFEKIKCNFAIIITEKTGNNEYKGNLVVQSVRPIYGTQYESPILNISDNNFSFEYIENENIIFNERQFSGKNLVDTIGFYAYLILGYDADSFKQGSGEQWFLKSQKVAQNAQNQKYKGWSSIEGQRTRGALIDNILREENGTLRDVFYEYHRLGLDNMTQNQAKSKIDLFQILMKLKTYENSFQINYPFTVFIDSKKDEIYNLFKANNPPQLNIAELKNLMNLFDPKDSDIKWNLWK